jgi:hypothetical protein
MLVKDKKQVEEVWLRWRRGRGYPSTSKLCDLTIELILKQRYGPESTVKIQPLLKSTFGVISKRSGFVECGSTAK